jgi:outer membrane protein OmpA-like peptidoglycan-associated protein
MKRSILIFTLATSLCAAQTPQEGSVPVVHLQVSRSIKAVNYLANKSTRIDFAGTALMARAEGQADVENKQGRTQVKAKFEGMVSPSQFGPEYLTYVLWAVSPEGRPLNLGEVVMKDGEGKLMATTRLTSFGLMVSAEPYFAVTYPSDAVVLENVIRADTKGVTTVVEAKYELFRRDEYRTEGMTALSQDPGVPLDVYEARNAMRIVQQGGAERYAAETWAKAQAALARTEDYLARKQKAAIPTAARETVQIAEDARLLTIRRKQEERLAQEKQAAAQAKAETQAAEAGRQAEERKRMEAQLAAAQEAQKRAEADAARQAAQMREQQATEAAQRAEREKHELRARLLEQFNRVLETRDTARGLVVNMGDVLFDTGKADLRSPAREALAKLSGIILNYPQLRLDIEGHTDSTGSDELNQRLSEQRAESVRSYLQMQGVNASQLSARGLGKTMPVADNATAAGRQKNRRVEIVVSGEVIGTRIGGNE